MSLLLKPASGGRAEERELTSADLDPLREILAGAHVALHDDPLRATWGPRTVLGMERGGERGFLALQTVNLSSWIAFPAAENDVERLAPSIRDVGTAVSTLNHEVAARSVRVGEYELVGASPNWLAVPFWW